MTTHIWIFLVVLLVQLTFAWFTAEDARKRGEPRWDWFFSVLLFGILAVLLYLLVRGDRRLPESERGPKNELNEPVLYFIVTFSGLLIIWFGIGGLVASIFETQYNQTPTSIRDIFILPGIIIPQLLLYLYMNDGLRERILNIY